MMKKQIAGLALIVALPISALAQKPTQPGWPQPVENNRSFGYARLNQNELRTGNGVSTYRWEGEGWYGGNLNRAWFKSEGNVNTDTGAVDEAETQVLYSRAISRYFDVQAGGRYDFGPVPSRGWAAFGVQGLAPLFFDLGVHGFVSTGGNYSARVEGSYDLLITQRLILQPQFEVNFYSKAEPRRGIGAGLSDLDSGLRLRYEIRRQLAPYVGITYEKRYGQTAEFARALGERTEDFRFVVGIWASI